MPLPIKEYYYNINDILISWQPFNKYGMRDFLLLVYEYDTEEQLLTFVQLPSDFTSNASIYNELLALILGKYHNEECVKIVKRMDEEAPTNEEIYSAFKEWGYNFVALLNDTYEYYIPLLTFYRSNKADLMNDIVATSKNKVKFNDTPQNANTLGAYEGDDYITHFTATENESKSPLASKIMRLKEIQENYKNVMYDWVKTFERLFYEGAD